MRDLGVMGESTFILWCAEVGLIPNGSKIDKTGWDFYVEFPFNTSTDPAEIHKSAFECKIQVKATDNNERKLSITLSNLRRLITAQMPAFFVFIEFDGASTAQRGFIVHVDNELISKVLKRLHELEQSDKNNSFNKRTMTIHYNESHLIENLNGNCLKKALLNHIGDDMAEYVANKKSHLESTGFEDGFAHLTFITEGEDNLKKLIDVSIGIEEEVDISHFKVTKTRFGIASKAPFINNEVGMFQMPNITPLSKGVVRFKEDKLSAGISFNSKLYSSPFNVMVADELKKIRIEGEFFDLKINPFTGAASYSFFFGGGVRLEVSQFRDAIKLLSLLRSPGKNLYAEFIFEEFPKFDFQVKRKEQNFNFSHELEILEYAIKILAYFNIPNCVDISFDEISRHEMQISQLVKIIDTLPASLWKFKFGLDDGLIDLNKEAACILLATAPIGSHIFGVLFVLIGRVEAIEHCRFRLITKEVIIEKRIVSEKNESISNEDLVAAIEAVEKKYDGDYTVVTTFNKNPTQTN